MRRIFLPSPVAIFGHMVSQVRYRCTYIPSVSTKIIPQFCNLSAAKQRHEIEKIVVRQAAQKNVPIFFQTIQLTMDTRQKKVETDGINLTGIIM